MTRAKPPVTPEVIQQLKSSVAKRRVSHLENAYGQFHERTIDASGSAGQLMTQMNKIYTLASGMGAVMRIVAGNPVVADQFEPEDPNSEAPLRDSTISRLNNMVAAICELISDEIDIAAADFNDRGQA